jgi:hypothetical protein
MEFGRPERFARVSRRRQAVKSLGWRSALFAGLLMPVLICGCGSSSDPASPVILEDEAPPVAPLGLHPSMDENGGPALEWTANASGAVVRYETFQYDPDPSRENAYIRLNDTDETDTRCSLPRLPGGTRAWFRVRAVTANDRHSAFSSTFEMKYSESASAGGGRGGSRRGDDGLSPTIELN